MDLTATLDTPYSVEIVQRVVGDLTTYPRWLDIVARVAPLDGDAWSVTLTAQLGPLRRSKRLRMVADPSTGNRAVAFVRAETDGRDHSEWRLTSVVSPRPGGSEVSMHLHYGGSLWAAPLDGLLRREIEASRPRLLAVIEEAAHAER